ncbi:MAG: bifunctional phosphoribosyl-AMP cyclohydrolase/phosphoribosyl-ATP diphosphatase HisIE [bacterium]
MNEIELFLKKIDFSKLNGLIPAVAQDYFSKEILMLAFMNEEALKKTVETGYAHYFSRSRKKLWKKGETSGHTQQIKEIFFDCDNDSILLKVEQKGPACHTGHRTCFYSKLNNRLPVNLENKNTYDDKEIFYSLKLLYDLIKSRKGSDVEKSYSAKLLKEGPEKIGKKLQEETLEVILSVIENDKDKKIYEFADLMFFYIIMLVYADIDFSEVIYELKRREGVSGLDEKKNR